MGTRFCPAAGKVAYVRHQEAEKIVARFTKANQGIASHPQSAYRCTVCRRWHVTSLTPDEAADHKRARGTPPPPKRTPRLRAFRPKVKRKPTPPPTRKPT